MQLRSVPPFTTVVVRTRYSVYRMVITRWPRVVIQGGAFFPDPTPARLYGAALGVGCRMHILWADRRIVTSRVRAITTERQQRH